MNPKTSSLVQHLGGAGLTVAVAGNNDVDTVERLVALHTLSVVVSAAYYITMVEVVPDNYNACGDTSIIFATLYCIEGRNFGTVAAHEHVRGGNIHVKASALIVEAYIDYQVIDVVDSTELEFLVPRLVVAFFHTLSCLMR